MAKGKKGETKKKKQSILKTDITLSSGIKNEAVGRIGVEVRLLVEGGSNQRNLLQSLLFGVTDEVRN